MSAYLAGVGLFSLLTLLAPLVQAQTVDTTRTVEDALQHLLDDREDQGEARELAEQLLDLAASSPNLNAASPETIALAPGIALHQARRLVRHRDAHGPFDSWAALDDIAGMPPDLRSRLQPYFTIRTHAPTQRFSVTDELRTLSVDWIQRVTRRLDLGRGYSSDTTRTTYLGSAERIYSRLRLRSQDHLQLHLTLDKDPGEPFRWHPASSTYGFDHVAGHVALRDLGSLRQLVLGDFAAEFGQGLTFGRSSAFGKGRDPIGPPVRSNRGVVPYGSTEENQFLRGVATTLAPFPGVAVSAFGSHRSLDATVETPETGADGAAERVVTARPLSGLHRTPSEIARKHTLQETLMGGALELSRDRWRLGLTGYHTRFSLPHVTNGAPRNRYRFTGRQATMGSLYGNVLANDWHLFGEVARGAQGGWAGVGGVTATLNDFTEVIVLARHYPARFITLHGHAFGEQSRTQNETGIYTGLRLRPHSSWSLSGYFDQFRFPWLRFRAPRPSTGRDARLTIQYRPSPRLTTYTQFRSKTRERQTAVPEESLRQLDGLASETRQSARLHARYTLGSALQLQSRLEMSRYHLRQQPREYGWLLYQDLRWQPTSWLQLDGRLSFFDTDSFNTRIWAYEHDLLYAFAVPAFQGEGHRSYLMGRFQPTSSITTQVKYGVTRWYDVSTVGSGLDEVDGNRIREIRLQLRVRL